MEVDKSLLGGDYTKTITRLQFASVAVKMTEKMLGRSITAAPAGTFTDTDNAYALKAYAARITTGDGRADIFNPNGTLTRQQMATFLYRALQYVKANSDTRYSPYTSKLNQFPDAGQVASWAKDAMAFMNAFDFIKGLDGKLAPNASCPIEQTVIVALRSLDAGMLGWYQNIKDEGNYGIDTSVKHLYGDRIWVTSLSTSYSGSTLHGRCIDPYGHSSYINLEKNVAPIKDL